MKAAPVDLEAYLGRDYVAKPHLVALFGRNAPLVLMDIGACEGEESIRLGRMFPRSRIWAFEPLPENQEIVRANFERYQASNAELVPFAVSDTAGTAQFHVSSGRPKEAAPDENWNYGNKSSSLLAPASDAPIFGWLEFTKTITVTCVTLDQFCRERSIGAIDFIHMDVQGAEHRVIAGARETLPRVKSIFLEVSDVQSYKEQMLRADMERLLSESGFVLVHHQPNGPEGDEFYVNRRFLKGLVYLRLLKARAFAARMRRGLASRLGLGRGRDGR